MGPGSNVVNLKDEIARVCAEHDRLMAEAAEEQRSQAEDALVYKTHEDAQVTVSELPSEESVARFGDWRDVVSEAIGTALALDRQRERAEREDSLAPLRREVAELRGQVSALLTLLQGAKAEVIGLPRKRPSDAA
jgi:hypothetical protein